MIPIRQGHFATSAGSPFWVNARRSPSSQHFFWVDHTAAEIPSLSSSSSCLCQSGLRVRVSTLVVVEKRQHQSCRGPRRRRSGTTLCRQACGHQCTSERTALPRTKNLTALVDWPSCEHGIWSNITGGIPRRLDRAVFDTACHRSDVLDHRVRQIDTLHPEMLELFAHPIRGARIIVPPNDAVRPSHLPGDARRQTISCRCVQPLA